LSVACTYSASGTHRALVRGMSIGHLHVRQQFPLVSGAPRDKLGMREPPAPGVPPRAVAALHPPRAGPRAHGPRCACVPVAGGGGVGVQRACSPEGRAAGDCSLSALVPRDNAVREKRGHPQRVGGAGGALARHSTRPDLAAVACHFHPGSLPPPLLLQIFHACPLESATVTNGTTAH
jgi:hypothetical protein